MSPSRAAIQPPRRRLAGLLHTCSAWTAAATLGLAGLVGLVTLGGITGCGASAAGPAVDTGTERRRAPAWDISAETYLDRVAWLASEELAGREPGSPGIAIAAVGIEQSFKDAGLAPAFVVDGQPSYRQPVGLTLGLRAAVQRLEVSGAPQASGRDFEALGMSPDATFSGQAVFVGYAIDEPRRNYDSFAGLGEDGLTGKVAVALRYEPVDDTGDSLWAREGRSWTASASFLRKANAAADRGAVALVVVDPSSSPGETLRTAADTDTSETAPIPVLHISPQLFVLLLEEAEVGGQIWSVYEGLANRGELPPEAWPGVTLSGEVRLDRPKITTVNVGGVVSGRGALADQTLVVGAHYDHLGEGPYGSRAPERVGEAHVGADDNASGTAGLLLAAAAWASRPPDSRPADERAVAFVAFTAEERGLIGSAHLVATPEELAFDLDGAAAMLNLDMVGRLRDDGLQLLGAGSGGDVLRKAIRLANAGHRLRLKQSDSPFGPSDHASFARKRIPSVMLFTGLHTDYHTPDDTVDKINAQGGAQVTAYLLDLLAELAWADAAPTWTATEREDPGNPANAPRFRVYLGVAPDYGSDPDVAGVPITGVTPDSPADKAGLQAGDAIVSWDGRSVDGLRDLMRELGRADPGEVTLGVMRNGQAMQAVAEVEPVDRNPGPDDASPTD
ncbi:MAG: M28 family peptidase [Planctomycetota bacterium]